MTKRQHLRTSVNKSLRGVRSPRITRPRRMPRRSKRVDAIRNIVVVSDLHCGCQLGLCPPDGMALDEGGRVMPSPLQRKVWAMWESFWGDWVPNATRGEPFSVVFNGDAMDGRHHNATTQMSHNLKDQVALAHRILAPVVQACEGRYWHIRGTEAHVGPSAAEEEALAKMLGAIPNADGQYARWELWKRLGRHLVHFLHHIGSTGSQAYESTALMKEMVESFVETGRWGDQPPQIIVRSHRHRCLELRMPTVGGYGMAVVTPAWQLKTPFVYRIPGARLSQPQIGGVLLRLGDEEVYSRSKVWRIERPEAE